jgi:DNA-binding protein
MAMLQSIPDNYVSTDVIVDSGGSPASDQNAVSIDNVIFIGNKPTMNYVLAIVTQFQNGQSEVVVRGRGKAISRAVDAVEVALHKFLPQIEKQQITTCTEEVEAEGGVIRVSAIEIVLTCQTKAKKVSL